MVKSTESRKFARTTKHLSRIQGIAPNREILTELLDDHRALEPPDPIPNSVVKRRIADGSVGSPHVRVGHRQASTPNPRIALAVRGFVFGATKSRLLLNSRGPTSLGSCFSSILFRAPLAVVIMRCLLPGIRMKKLLTLLQDGRFHSGKELGRVLGVSRSSVWKYLQRIETEQGINLFRVPGLSLIHI